MRSVIIIEGPDYNWYTSKAVREALYHQTAGKGFLYFKPESLHIFDSGKALNALSEILNTYFSPSPADEYTTVMLTHGNHKPYRGSCFLLGNFAGDCVPVRTVLKRFSQALEPAKRIDIFTTACMSGLVEPRDINVLPKGSTYAALSNSTNRFAEVLLGFKTLRNLPAFRCVSAECLLMNHLLNAQVEHNSPRIYTSTGGQFDAFMQTRRVPQIGERFSYSSMRLTIPSSPYDELPSAMGNTISTSKPITVSSYQLMLMTNGTFPNVEPRLQLGNYYPIPEWLSSNDFNYELVPSQQTITTEKFSVYSRPEQLLQRIAGKPFSKQQQKVIYRTLAPFLTGEHIIRLALNPILATFPELAQETPYKPGNYRANMTSLISELTHSNLYKRPLKDCYILPDIDSEQDLLNNFLLGELCFTSKAREALATAIALASTGRLEMSRHPLQHIKYDNETSTADIIAQKPLQAVITNEVSQAVKSSAKISAINSVSRLVKYAFMKKGQPNASVWQQITLYALYFMQSFMSYSLVGKNTTTALASALLETIQFAFLNMMLLGLSQSMHFGTRKLNKINWPRTARMMSKGATLAPHINIFYELSTKNTATVAASLATSTLVSHSMEKTGEFVIDRLV